MIKISQKISQLILGAKEAIFPSFCVNCGSETELITDYLCRKCELLIKINKSELCPGCGKLSSKSSYCNKCRRGQEIRGVYYASRFKSPVNELIHWYKYEQIKSIGDYLADLMIISIENKQLPDNAVLTYVPLHYKKLLKRGFNQSKDLAESLSKRLDIEHADALRRVRATKSQMKLKRGERLNNLSGAFKIKNSQLIRGKNILLVDDVMTTGNTLNECAKILKFAGAKNVYGLVVARD